MAIDVEQYWRNVVSGGTADDVDQVGHCDMGRAFNREAYALRLQAVKDALERVGCDPREGRIFEAAYGVGFYLDYWRSLGCRDVAGVDISERAQLTSSARFPEYSLRAGNLANLGDIEEWNNARGTFHLVTAIDVLYHLVDDELFRRALDGLGALTAPRGFLLVTEKFTHLSETRREGPIVVRRPRSVYDSVLAPHGLRHVATFPMFWCMDPPTAYDGVDASYRIARAIWIGLRAPLKYLPRNSALQGVFGSALGRVGRQIDQVVVPRLSETPNLSVAVYQRSLG